MGVPKYVFFRIFQCILTLITYWITTEHANANFPFFSVTRIQGLFHIKQKRTKTLLLTLNSVSCSESFLNRFIWMLQYTSSTNFLHDRLGILLLKIVGNKVQKRSKNRLVHNSLSLFNSLVMVLKNAMIKKKSVISYFYF